MPDSVNRARGGDLQAERVDLILSYHRRTKHHLHHYAQGPAGLDWANQPDPFRSFAGAPPVDLPLLADAIVAPYGDLYVPGAVAPRRLGLETVAILFELALGLSAWKEYRGTRWALRCNPSSGNLHPTEGYAFLPPLPGLSAGVYHYVSHDHRLERLLADFGPVPEFVAHRPGLSPHAEGARLAGVLGAHGLKKTSPADLIGHAKRVEDGAETAAG